MEVLVTIPATHLVRLEHPTMTAVILARRPSFRGPRNIALRYRIIRDVSITVIILNKFNPFYYSRYSRNARKKSIAPPGFRVKDDGNGIDYSPQNSVTSINSIASLLKEKIMVSIICRPKIESKLFLQRTEGSNRAEIGQVYICALWRWNRLNLRCHR